MPLKTCNTENMRKFVAALRSGDYTQGRKRLESIGENGVASQCCLGVACRVAIANGVEVAVTTFGNFETLDTLFDGNTSYMSTKVSQWLGLDENDYSDVGWTGNPELLTEDGTAHSATELNDVRGYTFAQIADCFERTYLTPESE